MEQIVLLGVLLPALLCGVSLLLLGRLGEDRRRSMGLATAIGLAAGYGAGQWIIIGWPDFPPIDVTHWLPYFAIAAAIIGIRESVWDSSAPLRWGIRALFCLAVVWLLLRPFLQNQWTAFQGALWLFGLGAFSLLLFWLLERLSEGTPSVAQPLVLIILASASSIVLVLSYSASLGQLAGCLAAALGAMTVLSFLISGVRLAPGGVPVVTALLTGLWVCGYFYASIPASSGLLLGASPAADWIGLRLSQQRPGWQSALIRAVAVSIPCVLAVWLAYQASAGSSDYPY